MPRRVLFRQARDIGVWAIVSSVEGMSVEPAPGRQRLAMSPIVASLAAGASMTAAVIGLSVASGILYHLAWYGTTGPVELYFGAGVLMTLLYLLPAASHGAFRLEAMLGRDMQPGRPVLSWIAAFAALVIIAYLTKTSAQHSRGWLVTYFVSGLIVIPVVEVALREMARHLTRVGRIAPRRILLIGLACEIERLQDCSLEASPEVRVIAVRQLDGQPTGDLDATLAEAAALARRLDIQDVVLAVPMHDNELIDRSVAAFCQLPVAIHLAAGRLGEQFDKLALTRLGPVSGLSLNAAPLRPWDALIKHVLDFTLAGLALIVLLPVFCAIAVAIKLDSRGPVFFRQRRRGYNQHEFRIWKFRTMTTLDDGDVVVQARQADDRVTTVGRFLRRTNLDELPQLINVVAGQMSLVGPRPHAVAHDRQFEARIARYPRRLNVRPGITGWAQIHGLRGETETDEKMAARVACDLHYIDNWSLALDLYIIGCTVVSPRSYRNAH